MSILKKNQPHNPLGDYLREARLNKGLTIKKSGADLNVATKYLEALESQEVRILPNEDYFDKLLIKYADYLDVNRQKVMELKNKADELSRFAHLDKQNYFSLSEWMSRLIIIVAVSGLVIFLLFKINAIFSPPSLNIISPEDGTVYYNRQLVVSGTTAKEAELLINNKATFVDQNGRFETVVDLQNGLNLIKISAKKRYSRTEDINLRVLFNE